LSYNEAFVPDGETFTGLYFYENVSPNPTLQMGQYYYKISSPGAGPLDELSDEYPAAPTPSQAWQGGILVSSPLPTPLPTSTPTETPTSLPPAVWQSHEWREIGVNYNSNRTMDIDEILTSNPHATYGSPGDKYAYQGYDYHVCWGGGMTQVPITPTPVFAIERRKEGDANWTQIAPSYQASVYDSQYHDFRERHYSFVEVGTNLSEGRYQYRVTYDIPGGGTLEWADSLTPTPGWSGGIQIVTPVNTPIPSHTPTAQNLLQDPKFYQRLVKHDNDDTKLIACHWKPFVWHTGPGGVGCTLPPTGTAVGLGFYPYYGRTESDAPNGGGLWSQMIGKDAGYNFCGGVYQQVRVSPGFQYRVRSHVRFSSGLNHDAVMLGVALDCDTDPRTAEFWEWDKKTGPTDPGNWGKIHAVGDSVLGGDWIHRQYFGGVATPVADTMTVFLVVQGFAEGYTNVLFNDVTVELVEGQASTPTPGPRNLGALWRVADGSTNEMILGCRGGDLVATAVPTVVGTVPANVPWRVFADGEGVYMDTDGAVRATGDLMDVFTSCDVPEPQDCLLRVRGASGDVVLAVDDLGNLFVRDGAGLTLSSDDDGDSLTNEAEVLTHNTDPRNLDSDMDGVSDYTELSTSGYPPLAFWGASPNHKDLWLELDWFEDGPPPTPYGPPPTYAPDSQSLQAVVDMFSESPRGNPDGIDGIKLHIDAGESLSVNFPSGWGGGSEIPYTECGQYVAIGTLANTYMEDKTDRQQVFRYAARRDQCTGSGGMASYYHHFDVYLPSTSHWTHLAQVIAHEFGHTLSQQGSLGDIDVFPNRNTVINYKCRFGIDADGDWLVPGFPGSDPSYPVDLDDSWTIDYSRGEWLSLTEDSIDERRGIAGPDQPVDFNHNGRIDQSATRRDFNGDGVEDSQTYDDRDEWGNIRFAPD